MRLALKRAGGSEFSDGWSATPQVQLVYSRVNFDSFDDFIGAHVFRKDGDSLKGRLSLLVDRELSWQSKVGDLRRLKIYGTGNVHYKFMNGTEVSVEGLDFRNEEPYSVWDGIGSGVAYD